MTKTFPFEIDIHSDIPLWIQLKNRLVYLIQSGYYEPGDRLPTVREIASQVSINYNTVNKAYLDLVHDGYITSSRGKGAYVNELDMEEGSEHNEELLEILDDCISVCQDLGLSPKDIERSLAIKVREMKQRSDVMP